MIIYVFSKIIGIYRFFWWLLYNFVVHLYSFRLLRRPIYFCRKGIICLTNSRHDRRFLLFRTEYLVIAAVPTQIDSWLCEICFQWQCIPNKTLLFILCHFSFSIGTLVSSLSLSGLCCRPICHNCRTILCIFKYSLFWYSYQWLTNLVQTWYTKGCTVSENKG